MNFEKLRVMRRIISFGLVVALLVLTSCLRTCAQEITLPREVAEFYYEQKKENDQRKLIIISQDSLIAKQVERIGIQGALIEEKDLEILSWSRSVSTLEVSRELSKREIKFLEKKIFWWKVKFIVTTTGLVLAIIIL